MTFPTFVRPCSSLLRLRFDGERRYPGLPRRQSDSAPVHLHMLLLKGLGGAGDPPSTSGGRAGGGTRLVAGLGGHPGPEGLRRRAAAVLALGGVEGQSAALPPAPSRVPARGGGVLSGGGAPEGRGEGRGLEARDDAAAAVAVTGGGGGGGVAVARGRRRGEDNGGGAGLALGPTTEGNKLDRLMVRYIAFNKLLLLLTHGWWVTMSCSCCQRQGPPWSPCA